MKNKNSSTLLLVSAILTLFIPFALLIGKAVPDVAMSLIVILFMAHSVKVNDFSWAKKYWILPLLLLWAYGCIHSLFISPHYANFLNALPWVRFILFAAALEHWILREQKWRDWLLYSCVFAIGFLAIDAIFQYIVGVDIFGRPKVGFRLTAMLDKLIVGVTIAWLYLPAMLGLVNKQKFISAFIFGLLCIAAVALSGERMALILVLSSLLIVSLLIKKLRKPALVILPFVTLMLAGLLYFKPAIYERQVSSTVAVLNNFWSSPYGVIWNSAINITKDYPLFGVGSDNFRHVCPDAKYGSDNVKVVGYSRCSTHPHNFYLQWLAETGFVGLTGFVVAMLFIFRRLLILFPQHKHDAVYIGLIVTFASRLWPIATSTSFFHVWFAVPLWLVIGWALALCYDPQDSDAK
jgi:O-antigen ligase